MFRQVLLCVTGHKGGLGRISVCRGIVLMAKLRGWRSNPRGCSLSNFSLY